MVEKDDWRLHNDVDNLKNLDMNPTDGEEIVKRVRYLKKCIFCWDKVQDTPHQWWFLPSDMSCCVCEECYNDFNEMFSWKKLDGWDIDWTLRCPQCGTTLTIISNQDYVYECEKCKILYDEDFENEQELSD